MTTRLPDFLAGVAVGVGLAALAVIVAAAFFLADSSDDSATTLPITTATQTATAKPTKHDTETVSTPYAPSPIWKTYNCNGMPSLLPCPEPTQNPLERFFGNPSAVCNDGTYSYSAHRRGTCSWHGGVRTWLKDLPP